MITTYLRSSSYSAYDFCPHKYYLQYVLGLFEPSNKKADKGNIVHKALELLAKRRIAELRNEERVSDIEVFGEDSIPAKSISPEFALEKAWAHCTSKFTNHQWEIADFNWCEKAINIVLDFNKGMFSPLNMNVLAAEQRFDFEIIKPWSHYKWGDIEGYLGLKGTIDLIVQPYENVIEIVDWKTGQRKDWNTNEEKTIVKLEDDPQLRIYYYAARQLYPDIQDVFITIFYIMDGGPFSICFSGNELERTEEMIKERFEKIKSTQRPKLIYPDWKCTKLCHFGKVKIGPNEDDKTICMHHKDEIIQLGIDRATKKYADMNKLTKYGAGGGKYE
jgi:ATP-dependent helicase/DNAse subunit B